MTAPKLVLVEWEDASTLGAGGVWERKTDLSVVTATIFQQVGWLLEWNAEYLLLTEAIGDELIAARNRIPAGMVKSVWVFDRKTAKRLRRS